MNQEELKLAHIRFRKELDDGLDPSEYDEICEALAKFRMKYDAPFKTFGTIYANRICAMLAVEAMYAWELAEWEQP